MLINLPVKDNPKLNALLDRFDREGVVASLWRHSDLNSLRAGVNDHGPTHIKIVANIALKIQRLLTEAGVPMSLTTDYGMPVEDAQVVVAIAGMLHDLGMSVHRDSHEEHSLFIAYEILNEAMDEVYAPAERVIMVSEILHAMIGHNSKKKCLTVEAGIVKLADALDMTKWRSRAIIKKGRVSIHSISAAAIDKVVIEKGRVKPVGVEILMNSSAGIFQVDGLLKHKLLKSGIQEHIEVSAHIEGPARHESLPVYNL
jgi:hypothetical protein